MAVRKSTDLRTELRSSHPPARPYRPNFFLRWLYGKFFRHIHVDERWSQAVRAAASRGTVVYVMRSLSLLDFLCLDYFVKEFGLPLVRFVNDLGLWILEPFGRGERRLRFRRQIPEDVALGQVIRDRGSALLFLRKPPAIGRTARKGEQLKTDLIRALVELQRQTDKPILLVPQTFVWSKLPPNRKGSILDIFFGPAEWPGRIRVFFQFILNFRNALLRSGDPFDLKEFLAGNLDLTDAQVADKVRYALLRRMEREREIVLGPSKKSPIRIREELLRSPRVRRHMESVARATNRRLAAIEREANKELARLAAAPSSVVLTVFHWILDRIWNRIYDGLVVDREGIDRVREAARDGTLVFLPSHKSHVDYLVLSDVLYMNALMPPLIAAGDNLNFFPIGFFLRRAGAFFIRRSFKGKKLYSALVDAYMRKLMLEGYSLEFFIEGGRSRTGKLLPPKLGLLSMVVDAALLLRGRKVRFVPVAIAYERIVEEKAYVTELAGGEKPKENIGGLLETRKVLRRKYGRVYLRFGEVIDFEAMVDDFAPAAVQAASPADGTDSQSIALAETATVTLTPPQRRQLVQKLAHRTMFEINRVTVATPAAVVATALLAHRRRGISAKHLKRMSETVERELHALGASMAESAASADGIMHDEVRDEAIALFLSGKLVVRHGQGADAVYTVPTDKRIALEYYKNNVLHFFVPRGLIACAIFSAGNEPISRTALLERVRKIARFFKHEFTYPTDVAFDNLVEQLLREGVLDEIADHFRPGVTTSAIRRLELYASFLRTYFESYRIALRALVLALEDRLQKKEWLKRALALGQRMYLCGEIDERESVSREKLENALHSLRDHGVVAFSEGEPLVVQESARDPNALREMEDQLDAYLR